MIKFLYLVNKQGQPRILKYFEVGDPTSRRLQEAEVIRRCLHQQQLQQPGSGTGSCSFIEHKGMRVVFRKYATLFFMVGVDESENELAVLEFIQNIVETLDTYFEKVCELDIMFNLDRVHMILDEMLCNGCIVEGSRSLALGPVLIMDKVLKWMH